MGHRVSMQFCCCPIAEDRVLSFERALVPIWKTMKSSSLSFYLTLIVWILALDSARLVCGERITCHLMFFISLFLLTSGTKDYQGILLKFFQLFVFMTLLQVPVLLFKNHMWQSLSSPPSGASMSRTASASTFFKNRFLASFTSPVTR